MIVSHRHRFIFLKPRKVAGTSVEVALAPLCAEDDIVTPVTEYDPRWDGEEYRPLGRDWPGYRRHGTLAEVRSRVGEDVWRSYFKFTVVRNPWDLVVSQFHWATRRTLESQPLGHVLARFVRQPGRSRRTVMLLASKLGLGLRGLEEPDFEFFATFLLRFYPSNDQQYFGDSGGAELDYYIRFEDLAEGFETACARIGVSAPGLPHLKTKSRGGSGYAAYYTTRTRSLVGLHYQRQIQAFGYRFEDA